MTLYALTTDGQTVTTTATLPPTGARRLDTGAWVTPPADGWTADLLAACGWLPVVEVPRPADTATTTSDPAPVALVAGVPTQQWTVRPWTAEELAAQASETRRRTIEESLALRMGTAQAIIDQTNADLRADPSHEIKELARGVRLLTRLQLGDYRGTA